MANEITLSQVLDSEFRKANRGVAGVRFEEVKVCPNGCGGVVTSDFHFAWTTDPFCQVCGACSHRQKIEAGTDYEASGEDLAKRLAIQAGRLFAETAFGDYISTFEWNRVLQY